MEKKRVVYFDVLNILAALSVIFLHCNGAVHTFSDTTQWKSALAVECICYWAVPIFLMLSGANLMNYREKYSTAEFFKKRFLKTVIPFVIWSLIAAFDKGIKISEIGVREFINRFIGSGFEQVYWFFLPLFAVYISMPVLSVLKDNRKILWYMAGGALILDSLLPSLFRYASLSWNGNLSMVTVGGMLIFPIIGYLFSVTDFTKKQRAVIYALGLFGVILRYSATYYLSFRDGVINKLFFSYTAYFSVFWACAVFTFIKYLPLCEKLSLSGTASKILKTVSGCSFGIYLIHMMVYRRLDDVISDGTLVWQFAVPFLIYIIAFAVTYVIKKIPILKNIVP